MLPTDEGFVATLAAMPPHSGVALRLLRMLDDPRVSAASLGQVIESDPALSIQVIRLANTTYYGLAEPVGSAWRALTVVGLSTARAVITSTAFGLFDRDNSIPDGYWEGSLARAACASVIARRIGLEPSDAFSLGLLQDIGCALIALRAPEYHDRIVGQLAADPTMPPTEAERAVLGRDHGEISASALAAARFAPDAVDAVRRHHADGLGDDPGDGADGDRDGDRHEHPGPAATALLLRAGDVAADLLLARPVDDGGLDADLAALGIAERRQIMDDATEEYEGLSTFLTFS